MRYYTLTRNNEFARAYARGKSFVHAHLVLYVNKNRVGKTRIGLTATKKIGNAVKRNRARRVMRAALGQVLPQFIGNVDLVLVARGLTPKLKSTQVEKTLRMLFEKAGLPTLPAQRATPALAQVAPQPVAVAHHPANAGATPAALYVNNHV